MSGNEEREMTEFEKKWNALTDEQKITALLPRLELMLSMIRGAHDFFKQNNVPCDQFEKGMTLLNMGIQEKLDEKDND